MYVLLYRVRKQDAQEKGRLLHRSNRARKPSFSALRSGHRSGCLLLNLSDAIVQGWAGGGKLGESTLLEKTASDLANDRAEEKTLQHTVPENQWTGPNSML